MLTTVSIFTHNRTSSGVFVNVSSFLAASWPVRSWALNGTVSEAGVRSLMLVGPGTIQSQEPAELLSLLVVAFGSPDARTAAWLLNVFRAAQFGLAHLCKLKVNGSRCGLVALCGCKGSQNCFALST